MNFVKVKWDWSSLFVMTLILFILGTELRTLPSPVLDDIQSWGYQYSEESNPVASYLWLWIKWICYALGGIFASVGLILFLMGWYFNNANQTKQGWKAAVAGFGFVLVIPFTRIVFGEWLTFTDEVPFVPEPTTMLLLESWFKTLV